MSNSTTISVLFHNRPVGERKPNQPRPVRQSLEQFKASHPVNALEALRRNADAYERHLREQSRARTFTPTYAQPSAERKVA